MLLPQPTPSLKLIWVWFTGYCPRQQPRHKTWVYWASAVGLLLIGVMRTPPAQALPENGELVDGKVTIEQPTPNEMKVHQESDRAIVNWESFNVSQPEKVTFEQPSADSAILNRVTGDTPSEIAGQISANGQVMLVNPNGIVFTETSQVDVAGLTATTLDVKNQDFMENQIKLEEVPDKPPAAVVNRGQITVKEAGYAALVAPSVENSGVISARMGKVVMAAGTQATLDFEGDGLVSIAVDPAVITKLVQKGEILVEGGKVLLSAAVGAELVDQVFNVSGLVQARTIENHQGEIILSAGDKGTAIVTGTLDASGQRPGEIGGTVQVLGDRVGLAEQAKIDVSGDRGGGTILVGGDYQGKGSVQNASRTFVGSEVQMNVSALNQGNGGKAIVWADEITRFFGQVIAHGGSIQGNGGFVEVSGKQLQYQGRVDAYAPQGQSGTLLLDPQDIYIQDPVSLPPNTYSGPVNFNDAPTTLDIDGSSIWTSLLTGNATLQANRDIIINYNIGNPLLPSPGYTLTLEAGRSINFNQNLILPGANFVGKINADGANLTERGTGDASFNLNTFTLRARDITITSGNADASAQSNVVLGLGQIWSDDTSFTTGGAINIDVSGSITASAPSGPFLSIYSAGASAGGTIRLSASSITLDNVYIRSTDSDFITGNTITLAADEINLNTTHALVTPSTITLQPRSSDQNIVIGGSSSTGVLDITQAVLTALDTNGFTTFQPSQIIIGASGNTGTVTIASAFSAPAPVAIVGGSTLIGPDLNTTWNITGANSGNLNSLIPTGLSFSNIANLTGGTADDTFLLQGGSISGLIDGGGGNNTIVADNSNNTFNLTGLNSGNINGTNNFVNIQNLTGGSGDDVFVFANTDAEVEGIIDGGGGTNTLDYTNYLSAFAVDIAAGTATATGGIRNIQGFIPTTAATAPIPTIFANQTGESNAENLFVVDRQAVDEATGVDYLESPNTTPAISSTAKNNSSSGNNSNNSNNNAANNNSSPNSPAAPAANPPSGFESIIPNFGSVFDNPPDLGLPALTDNLSNALNSLATTDFLSNPTAFVQQVLNLLNQIPDVPVAPTVATGTGEPTELEKLLADDSIDGATGGDRQTSRQSAETILLATVLLSLTGFAGGSASNDSNDS